MTKYYTISVSQLTDDTYSVTDEDINERIEEIISAYDGQVDDITKSAIRIGDDYFNNN